MEATIYLYLVVALCLPSINGSMMTGGWKKRDPNDPKIQELAKYGVTEFNRKSNFIYQYNVIRVVSAESQVVAGENYHITVKLGETDCRKNYSEGEANAQSCDLQNTTINKVITCTFTIFYQAWENRTEMTNFTCPS